MQICDTLIGSVLALGDFCATAAISLVWGLVLNMCPKGPNLGSHVYKVDRSFRNLWTWVTRDTTTLESHIITQIEWNHGDKHRDAVWCKDAFRIFACFYIWFQYADLLNLLQHKSTSRKLSPIYRAPFVQRLLFFGFGTVCYRTLADQIFAKGFDSAGPASGL